MKFNRQVRRTVAWIAWSVFGGTGSFLFFRLLIIERDPYGFLVLIFPVFSSFMLALFLYEYPNVSLNEQGVRVKWWLRTRFYPWGDIRQAGIICFYPRGYYVNRLVLFRTGCSKRGYRDFLFHLKNFGKLIYIPAKPDSINFVRSCYGPLDFDLTDGRAEESVEVEIPLDTSSDW